MTSTVERLAPRTTGRRVARASGVRIDLDPGAFAKDRDALHSAARAVAAASGLGDPGWGPGTADIDGLVDSWVWAGGEDHGLLATFPPDVELPAGWAVVGLVHGVGEAGPGEGWGGRRWAGWGWGGRHDRW